MKKLTEGNPFKVIILFSIPLLIGQLFQLFYNLVDTRIVGETLGESALAAVGATTTLSDLIVQFIVGVTSGFAILVAHFFGAKDRKNLKKTIGGTLLLGVLASLLITVVCLVLLDPFLRLLNVEDAIYTDAKGYIRIILAGLIFTALYNICAGVLRAIGDTITPLIFLIFSAFVNIVLDYTLILYAHMGVEGAALATVLSQVLSVVLCFGYIRRKYVDLIPGINELRPDKELYHRLLQSGISMGFMSSFVNLGTLFLQTCINTFGAVIIVSHAASRKLTSIFMLTIMKRSCRKETASSTTVLTDGCSVKATSCTFLLAVMLTSTLAYVDILQATSLFPMPQEMYSKPWQHKWSLTDKVAHTNIQETPLLSPSHSAQQHIFTTF